MGIIYACAFIAYACWIIASMACAIMMKSFDVNDDNKAFIIVREIHNELKPFVLPAIVVIAIFQDGPMSARIINTVFNIAFWWAYKDLDNDDDRWKKRKRKLKDKVQVSGSKLVVVPELT